MFKCVVLYDVLSENFTLHPLVCYRGGKTVAVGGVSLKDSKGEEVKQVLQPGEAVVVKVRNLFIVYKVCSVLTFTFFLPQPNLYPSSSPSSSPITLCSILGAFFLPFTLSSLLFPLPPPLGVGQPNNRHQGAGSGVPVC